MESTSNLPGAERQRVTVLGQNLCPFVQQVFTEEAIYGLRPTKWVSEP